MAVDNLYGTRRVDTIGFSGLIVIFGLHRDERRLVNPAAVARKLGRPWFLRCRAHNIVGIRFFFEDVIVLPRPTSRYILIEEVRSNKACPFVRWRDPFHQIKRWQIKPAVVVGIGVLPDEKGRSVHVSGTVKEDVKTLLAIVDIVHIRTQDYEIARAFAALAIEDRHVDASAPVPALIIGCGACAIDDLLNVRGSLGKL